MERRPDGVNRPREVRLLAEEMGCYNPDVDPRIGTEIAGHRIERVIGRGGASVVYLAEHLRLGRKAALKVLAPHLAEDETFRERFIRESRIAAEMEHPNIVSIYDSGEADDCLYLSMRYVDGSDLGKVLRAEGPLSGARTILILEQVASALDAAHARGLVHRDVKPGNLLLENLEDDAERAYLADFGISKRTTTGSGLTRTGQFVGSVDYVAPEQIRNEPIDGRTDVYSLGCVLFHCLSGHVPFPSDTDVATIYSHLHDPPPSLGGEAAPAIDGVDDVVATALAKSKEDRQPTCSALIDAARDSLRGERGAVAVVRPAAEAVRASAEPRAKVIAEPRPATRPFRRRAVWFGAGSVAVTAAIVGSVLIALPRDEPAGRDQDIGGSTGAVSPSPSPSSLALPQVTTCGMSIPATAWWSWDGSEVDAVGGADAELYGDAAFEPGIVGEALTLDGEGDFALVPNDSDLHPGRRDFTVATWVRFANTGGARPIVRDFFGPRDGVLRGWGLEMIDDGRRGYSLRHALTLALMNVGFGVTDPIEIPKSTWIHVAVRRQGDAWSLFVNAEEVLTGAVEDPRGSVTNTESPLTFGRGGRTRDPDHLDGQLDESMIVIGHALSDDEIRSLFEAQSSC